MERIKRFELDIIRSSKVFSDQLCFNLQALFVNDRIIKYADKISSNEKFKLMVRYFIIDIGEMPGAPPAELGRRLDPLKEMDSKTSRGGAILLIRH